MKKNILVLLHSSLVPPLKEVSKKTRGQAPWSTEYDVIKQLQKQGHNVAVVGIDSDLRVLRKEIEENSPDIVFNLLEEFAGNPILDQNVVSYLELLGIPYTGSNPRGLMLARDKALAKKIFSFHKIKTPKFKVYKFRKPIPKTNSLSFPLIVKCLNEEASMGISKASVVSNINELHQRIYFIHKKFETDALVEEFILGREFYIGIQGNQKLTAFPPLELIFENSKNPLSEFYTVNAKFNKKYRIRKGIKTVPAKISLKLKNEMIKTAKKAYKALDISGYARIDIRLDQDSNIHILEVNPNPDIAYDDEFAIAARLSEIDYSTLIKKTLSLGLTWSEQLSSF